MLTITIDWLAGSIQEWTHETQGFLSWLGGSPDIDAVKAQNGYTEAYKTPQGVVIQRNVDRSDMGIHVSFPGSALRDLRNTGMAGAQEVLRRFLNAGGRISRLDLAKDLTGVGFDYERTWKALESREYTGTARSSARMQGHDGGTTIYVGSRQSERFLRLYDKAIESKMDGAQWTRLEIELKGMTARAVATFLNEHENWSSVFDMNVRQMCDLSQLKTWMQFFPDKPVPIGIPKLEKQTDTERWIATQVYPAIMRYAGENPDSEALRTLLTSLMFLLERQPNT